MAYYYPVYLDLTDRQCIVIGHGLEIERKVQGLLECRATVTVISESLTVVIKDLVSRGLVGWKQRGYLSGDLRGAFLVICDREYPNVYRKVAEEAKKERALLNVMDVPSYCDFIAPAIVRRGEVAFAISSGGMSPALTRRLKNELLDSPIMLWADLVDLLAKVREDLRKKGIKPEPNLWQASMDEHLLELFHTGRKTEARERLTGMLEGGTISRRDPES